MVYMNLPDKIQLIQDEKSISVKICSLFNQIREAFLSS